MALSFLAGDDRARLTAIQKSQAIIEFSPDGRIQSANPNFLAAMGYGLDEIRGKHHSMFVDAAYRDSADYKAFWAALNRGEHQAAQFKRQTDEAIEAYEKALAEARAKAHEIAQETRDRLHEETERQRLAIEARLAEKISEAEKQIAATKEAALANVRSVAVDVADAIVVQLLGEADRSASERAVDTELK